MGGRYDWLRVVLQKIMKMACIMWIRMETLIKRVGMELVEEHCFVLKRVSFLLFALHVNFIANQI